MFEYLKKERHDVVFLDSELKAAYEIRKYNCSDNLDFITQNAAVLSGYE